MILKPTTLITIRNPSGYQWEICQRFERLDGEQITIHAYGWTRDEALRRFEDELWWAEHDRPFDMLEDMANLLWNVAGIVDSVSLWIRRIQNEKT